MARCDRLYPGAEVSDWRDTKLESNYLFYSVTVKVCCQLENEYKLINSIFIWHAADRSCFSPEPNVSVCSPGEFQQQGERERRQKSALQTNKHRNSPRSDLIQETFERTCDRPNLTLQ